MHSKLAKGDGVVGRGSAWHATKSVIGFFTPSLAPKGEVKVLCVIEFAGGL
jgi:hypothetical protein